MPHSNFARSLPNSMDRVERFWRLVTPTEGCWLWQGYTGKATGYGHLGPFMAHRFSYELLVGPIPRGMQIDHLCRVRACVNPEHLEVVTPRENYLRGMGLPAQNARKTRCIRGHEYTPENTGRVVKTGWRFCKACLASGFGHPDKKRVSYRDKWPIEQRRAYWRECWRRREERKHKSETS